MKIVKRILIVLLVLIVLLIGSAIALPFIFKDEIVALAKEEINKNINAKVDFSGVDLSLFRDFPNLNFQMNDFLVDGIDEFEGIRLAEGKQLGFSLDLKSVIAKSGAINVRSVELIEPKINIIVLKDGKANYDIAIASDEITEETSSESDYSGFKAELKAYRIVDGHLVYDDRSSDTYVEIEDLDHEGTGNFTIDVFDLDTETQIAAMTVSQGNITYLKKAKMHLDAIFNIDQKNSKYSLKDNMLTINALQVNAEGFVQLKKADDILLDLKFNTPKNNFKELLSLIPNAYIEGYENVKASGDFSLDGSVNGVYNGEREQLPAFLVNVSINNGNFQYPGLPLGVTNINADINVNSPESDLDKMVINASKFSITVGDNPFSAQFRLSTPISDPNVDAQIKGVIDLEAISKAFPLEDIDELAGLIKADVKIKARMSQIDRGDYEAVNMSGTADISNLKYQSAGLPNIMINQAAMTFNPKRVEVSNFDAKLGKSDIKANGSIDNILAYISPDKTMKGDFIIRSRHFDAGEWVTEEETSSPTATPQALGASPATNTESTEIFDRFDFKVDAAIDEIVYDEYRLQNTKAVGQLSPVRMNVQSFETVIGKSDLQGSGTIANIFDYVFEGGTLGGNLNVRSNLFDLNQFMTEDGSVPPASGQTTMNEEALDPILVPKNIDMTIKARINKLLYTNMTLTDLIGTLAVKDEAVVIEEGKTKALGGEIDLAGGYDTKNQDAPAFNIKFDLQSLDFQESFNTFNTFQSMAPIGKFIKGNFNTTMILSGELGKDMMPNLNTLDAQGFLQTINGVINSFKPLQVVGNLLNVDHLKESLKLNNTKNWFEIKNGVVELKEAKHDFKDIAMTIGGTHGLNQEMNYNLTAAIPRKYLENNAAGAAVNTGLAAVRDQASKLGIQIKQSEVLNVLIQLTGSLTDPKVKFKLLGADGQASLGDAVKDAAKEEFDKQKEKLQNEVKEKVDETKAKVQEGVDKAVDSLRNVAKEKVDQAKEDLENKAKEALQNQLDSIAKKKAEELKNDKATQEAADKIKEELEKFNPFKKKKKDGDGGK
ncbi:MAG: hypothetical protein DHS20C18_16300 [Saprospiraceae bacterium]|nr:MAG: hypothetical protein DHS20C18_16300 [Saprospiraceae bacterium]